MGKVKKVNKNKKKLGIKKNEGPKKTNNIKLLTKRFDSENDSNNVATDLFDNRLSSTKDSDIMSVKSFKSIKDKFGIKKRITKREKLKLKKDVLKQKVDFLMESVNSEKPSKLKKNSKKKNVQNKDQESDAVKIPLVIDQEEEYLKISKKIRGIAKRKKRQQETTKDINQLKKLMFKTEKPK